MVGKIIESREGEASAESRVFIGTRQTKRPRGSVALPTGALPTMDGPLQCAAVFCGQVSVALSIASRLAVGSRGTAVATVGPGRFQVGFQFGLINGRIFVGIDAFQIAL